VSDLGFGGMTVTEVQAWLATRVHKETDCPCCHRRVRYRRRPLNNNMATFLVSLDAIYLRNGNQWVHHKKCTYKDRDYTALAYWGLIEPKVNLSTKKRTSGFWRPTERGHAFAWNRITVLSHIVTYNSTLISIDGTPVTISQVKDFDFGAMMADHGIGGAYPSFPPPRPEPPVPRGTIIQ